MIYGDLPQDLGLIDLSPAEMMFWIYCPIWTPEEGPVVPPNLRQFWPIVQAAINREGGLSGYGYLTARTLWVGGDYSGSRPGWHADGFGTEDINYIWSDHAPTEFIEDSFELPVGCADAMAVMAGYASKGDIVTYPAKHLLRLTPAVIHRPPENVSPGIRSFVKLSISKDRYNLEGNSINHGLAEKFDYVPRQAERNHPHTVTT